jgi:CheY-like chemotaxis protein
MSGDARILVVDDVPPNVRLLEAVLVMRGYDVVSATDGARARARRVGQAHPVREGVVQLASDVQDSRADDKPSRVRANERSGCLCLTGCG